MKTIDKLAWIEIADRKMLFVRTRGRTLFYFPGGKRVDNETDAQALTRELREELGIRFKPQSAKMMGKFSAPADAQSEPTEVVSTCYTGEYEGELAPHSEIEEIAWLDSRDRDKLTPMGHLVIDELVARGLID